MKIKTLLTLCALIGLNSQHNLNASSAMSAEEDAAAALRELEELLDDAPAVAENEIVSLFIPFIKLNGFSDVAKVTDEILSSLVPAYLSDQNRPATDEAIKKVTDEFKAYVTSQALRK